MEGVYKAHYAGTFPFRDSKNYFLTEKDFA